MAIRLSYIQGADLPDAALTLEANDGSVIDFSSGYTFVLKVGIPGSAATLTKSTGITGAATSPNVTIAWATTGELNTLAIGTYKIQLVATRTADSKNRIFDGDLTIRPAIT